MFSTSIRCTRDLGRNEATDTDLLVVLGTDTDPTERVHTRHRNGRLKARDALAKKCSRHPGTLAGAMAARRYRLTANLRVFIVCIGSDTVIPTGCQAATHRHVVAR